MRPQGPQSAVVWATVLATVLCSALSHAGPKPAPVTTRPTSQPGASWRPADPNEARILIDLLGNDSTRTREAATEKLAQMGPGLYPLLKAKLQDKDMDLEVKLRLEMVMAKIAAAMPWPFDANEAAMRQEQTCKAMGLEKKVTLDLGRKTTMAMVLIPPGSFTMGSSDKEQAWVHEDTRRQGQTDASDWYKDESPQHRVSITGPFYMGIFHVTKGQFAAFVSDSKYKTQAENEGKCQVWTNGGWGTERDISWRKPGFEQTDDHPVVCVSYDDATAFCGWLSKKTGKTVRLPTEAQWEYACRAGVDTAYIWGDDPNDGKGWCNANDQTPGKRHKWGAFPWSAGYSNTSPVGKFKANAFGLYDMHGNAWQWCSDWYDEKYYSSADAVDPTGPASGEKRCLRGGAWGTDPWNCRCANRYWLEPKGCATLTGFRVVLAVD